jgi:hypothetical protein
VNPHILKKLELKCANGLTCPVFSRDIASYAGMLLICEAHSIKFHTQKISPDTPLYYRQEFQSFVLGDCALGYFVVTTLQYSVRLINIYICIVFDSKESHKNALQLVMKLLW